MELTGLSEEKINELEQAIKTVSIQQTAAFQESLQAFIVNASAQIESLVQKARESDDMVEPMPDEMKAMLQSIIDPADDHALEIILGLILNSGPSAEEISGWTREQKISAEDWAVSLHMSWTQDTKVEVPDCPNFLTEYEVMECPDPTG